VLDGDSLKQRLWGAIQAWPDFRAEVENILVMGDKAQGPKGDAGSPLGPCVCL
jgi:hypothetical protein